MRSHSHSAFERYSKKWDRRQIKHSRKWRADRKLRMQSAGVNKHVRSPTPDCFKCVRTRDVPGKENRRCSPTLPIVFVRQQCAGRTRWIERGSARTRKRQIYKMKNATNCAEVERPRFGHPSHCPIPCRCLERSFISVKRGAHAFDWECILRVNVRAMHASFFYTSRPQAFAPSRRITKGTAFRIVHCGWSDIAICQSASTASPQHTLT